MVRDLTVGNPLKQILFFSIPLVIGNLFQQFYNMADTILVGKFLGVDALAAVGATGSLNFMVLGFATGCCSGLTIRVAQYFGAKDFKNMRRCVTNAFYITLGISVLLTVTTVLLTGPVLRLIQTPENIIEDAYRYIVVIFAGIGVTMLYNLLAGILRALGDSKTPLVFLVLSSVLNVGLDCLFILSFHSGVAGAAYATVISQAVSALLCFLYIKKRFSVLKMERDDFSFYGGHIARMLFIGVPMGLQFSITAVGSVILQGAVNTLGSNAVAAVTAGSKIQALITQPLETLGITMATYCGQNLGAGKIDRIRKGIKNAAFSGIAYAAIGCLLVTFFGRQMAYLFLDPSETAILDEVMTFSIINGLFFPLLALLLVYRNSLQGLGYSVPAMGAGLFELVARTVIAFCLVGNYGYVAVCFANPAAWMAAVVLLLPLYYYQLRQLSRRLSPSSAAA